ncbi:MAG: hypothetical protein Ct9H90mP24_1240 [Methanobacteriota archaeon]|nr:MAG: hypothetical protein Ct9H90mP24_1240 [Euryarchaeota archaeon]
MTHGRMPVYEENVDEMVAQFFVARFSEEPR